MHINAYGMPKHNAGLLLAIYEATKVDWGTVTGAPLREGLHAFQDGKKLKPIIQQYLTILCPPRTLPPPSPKTSRRRLEELATSTWEDDSTASRCSLTPPPRPTAPPSAPKTTRAPREEEEEQRTSPQPKRRRLDRKNRKGLAKDATRLVVTLISKSHEEVVLTRDTVCGKGTLIPDKEVMVYLEIPDMAHEFGARLQLGTTFEVMEFLAKQQIKLSQRMVGEHAKMQMI